MQPLFWLPHKANLQDQKGRTALFRAVTHSHLEVVRWLLELRADANICDSSRTSPLHVALQRPAQPELSKLLLEHRANADVTDEELRTPLHTIAACRQGDTAKTLELAERILGGRRELTLRRDMDDWTPLHEAALSGNVDVLKLLLEHLCEEGPAKADAIEKLSAKSSKHLPHLLHLAVIGKSRDCVEALLQANAEPHGNAVITWSPEHFEIPHHYRYVGLGLTRSAILGTHFDRILFKTRVSPAEFSRNVSKYLNQFKKNRRRQEPQALFSCNGFEMIRTKQVRAEGAQHKRSFGCILRHHLRRSSEAGSEADRALQFALFDS